MNIKPPHIALLSVAVSVGLHFLLPPEYRRQFACLPCGITALGLGFGLGIWGLMLFSRSGTSSNPTAQATTLVTSGPYCFSRNPMYLGVLLILLGIALWVGSLPMLLAPTGFLAVMSGFYIPREEQRLRKLFGDTYDAYTKKVRRWI